MHHPIPAAVLVVSALAALALASAAPAEALHFCGGGEPRGLVEAGVPGGGSDWFWDQTADEVRYVLAGAAARLTLWQEYVTPWGSECLGLGCPDHPTLDVCDAEAGEHLLQVRWDGLYALAALCGAGVAQPC